MIYLAHAKLWISKMKIAVIGSGISGLASAYLLSQQHEVHLFESSDRAGGHAHTIEWDEHGRALPMDTGFLVYNEMTYPHLTAFFSYLNVETVDSDMSLSIRNDSFGLEWAGTNLNTTFGQRKNIFKPSFYLTLVEILRFHREVNSNLILARQLEWTIRDLLRQRKYSSSFSNNYLLPMAAAIWSTPEFGMLDFPAETFLNFLINHKLVQVNDRPIWKTVKGGSIQYVSKVVGKLANVRLNTPVLSVRREQNSVELTTHQGKTNFDKVVFGTHVPTTRKILEMNVKEREVLGAFQVVSNTGVLHQDASLMPQEKRCWASWNVFADGESDKGKVSLTYHLNRLQPIDTKENYFLTLNPNLEVKGPKREFKYDHPRFDMSAIRAQSELKSIQGIDRVYFAGAWTRYGFHEDGILSAVRVAEMMGVATPWTIA
jgi:uncharacterized protein